MSPCGGKGPELSLSVSVGPGRPRMCVSSYIVYSMSPVHGMSMSAGDAWGKVRLHGKPYDCRLLAKWLKLSVLA